MSSTKKFIKKTVVFDSIPADVSFTSEPYVFDTLDAVSLECVWSGIQLREGSINFEGSITGDNWVAVTSEAANISGDNGSILLSATDEAQPVIMFPLVRVVFDRGNIVSGTVSCFLSAKEG